ncbi:rhomboid family intramembrane serine protease [Blastopirellula sp. JC732]|uniref:Rhomboid family intramembrane serine protease n=1 Tax=Blastopirellula sediminis TaxID=2894196 RepID=A0A9X1SHQ3_9BACT|nr:rhomboid family intramembrane serine protease [Blastopirellula sediminis]MCC9606345.1 rhomboid family intramembrane serine protease [Blastopirellula sediminis]MCC9630357.1 rhomboid family intramembrane serine protease [Blastopirellula sediminis]
MRQIGAIATDREAARFIDYLLTQGIDAKAEPRDGKFLVWIHDEGQIDQARSELSAYLSNPNDQRYADAAKEANSIRKVEYLKNEQRRKNVHDMRGKLGGVGMMARATPVTMTIMWICIAVTAFSMLGPSIVNGLPRNWLIDWLTFAPAAMIPQAIRSHDPFVAIEAGQVWRLITPIFPHGGLMHIVFNMWMWYSFGGILERRLGSGRYLAMVLGLTLFANIASAMASIYISGNGGELYAIGISGVLFGLFGFAWAKSTFEPQFGIYLPGQMVIVMMFWFGLCWMGYVGNIANWGHTCGLVAGVIAGFIPSGSSR